MHDVHTPADDVTSQTHLLTDRTWAPEGGDRVFAQRNISFRDRVHKRPYAVHARDFQIEAVVCECATERRDLILGAATVQRRQDLEYPDRSIRRHVVTGSASSRTE